MKFDVIVPAFVAAIVSISVVFLGRRSETIRQLQTLRTAAYVDFIRAVAGLASLQKETVQQREHFLKGWELKMLLADAKARIAIYGGEAVVSSMASFLRGDPILDSPERAKEFTAICQKMRDDSRPKPGEVNDRDVHFLLFGLDLGDY
ncbi:MAG: hypothetical protein LAN36_08635 [Acidobacteriia bacterium]|nr:hypothetical protein [Terriglobia bacterium]